MLVKIIEYVIHYICIEYHKHKALQACNNRIKVIQRVQNSVQRLQVNLSSIDGLFPDEYLSLLNKSEDMLQQALSRYDQYKDNMIRHEYQIALTVSDCAEHNFNKGIEYFNQFKFNFIHYLDCIRELSIT